MSHSEPAETSDASAQDIARPEDGQLNETSFDKREISRRIVESCGRGLTLDVGYGEDTLVSTLLERGADAFGVSTSNIVRTWAAQHLPGRFSAGSILALPFADDSLETVVAAHGLEHLCTDDIPKALKELLRVTKRSAFLRIPTQDCNDGRQTGTAQGREWWERHCLEAGFRKHPLYYRLNPYELLERKPSQIIIVLEKPRAIHDFPPSELESEALLHRDMLRETGRRSDAHCVRYHEAANYVRPGDTVLDVACGLGYGSHILWNTSQAAQVIGVDNSAGAVAYANHCYGDGTSVRFRAGDAENLLALEDNSVDFIASFETIEHLQNPTAYLRELQRVLRPAGRLMLSAPNNWADETGADPNPYHFHVYTWDRLRTECGSFFLLEQGMIQTAGGAQRLHHGLREWTRISAIEELPHDAEWILLLCMKNPTKGQSVPYRETTWQLPDDPAFNVLAFGRDYQNPWLAKGMVAIGLRNTSPDNLTTMRDATRQSSAPDSADYGAALCGEVYAQMASGPPSLEAYAALAAEIRRFASIPDPTPHQLRWQTSLLFAGGELAMQTGRRADAEGFFGRCAALDALRFSPLLGTKTLDALFRMAGLALSRKDTSTALDILRRSVAEGQRLISGSWLNAIGDEAHPIPAGPAELAALMDKTARAAYLIAAIERGGERPALVEREAVGFFERQISALQQSSPGAAGGGAAQSAYIAELVAHNEHLVAEVMHLNKNVTMLAEEVHRQHANAEAIAKEARAQSASAQDYARRANDLASELSAIRKNPLRLLKRRR